ncbi:MAG: J domain-containing protein [Deltaproteobacteria bacterium]|nr:J domain-containing protein [Deltaproteobacteria bacterium]
MARKKAINVLKDADDLMYLLTGKRIKHIGRRAVELFGQDLVNRLIQTNASGPLDPLDPYSILEVRRDASDIVVKASFRAKVKILHPDTATIPDTEQLQKVNEAYNEIIRERNSENNKL